jgi:ABC-type microcin C transport system permease subunit YejB
VILLNTTVISVKYSGYGKYHNTQSIFDVKYATNINIQESEPIDFEKIFTDEFECKLSRNIFAYSGGDKVKDGELIEENTHEFGFVEADEEIINAMFSEYYASIDSESYYFNNSTLTLIVPVISEDSAFLELSADFDELLVIIAYIE